MMTLMTIIMTKRTMIIIIINIIIITVTMQIYKAPTPRSKRWTSIAHIMYSEMENVIHNLTKANT